MELEASSKEVNKRKKIDKMDKKKIEVINLKTKVVNVSDEKDVGTLQMFNSTKRQTIMLKDDNINVRTTPSINFDSPKIKACKLPSVQNET